MAMRFLPKTCKHGNAVNFGARSIDESHAAHGWVFTNCRDAAKNLRYHWDDELGEVDNSLYSPREIELGAGRKTRSDKGVRRG